jgi:lipopolysaccharide transport system ATP-binding protein
MDLDNEIKENSIEEVPSNEIVASGDDIAISVKNLTMEFKVTKDKIDTLKEYVIRTLKRNKADSKKIKVLKDISFTVKKGDRLGILGYNGAGKSTLLKIVSGIYEPTSGEVEINGKIAPLLELGAGFDNNYSGKNNIYLNAAFLSMDSDFIDQKYDEIVEFSELGEFINYPVKNYSSGMRAKLGFSIATMVNPDILIIDEILSVGDIKFKKKSSEKIKSLMSEGVTVLLVSHSVNQIRDICNKCIWIENGHLVMDGDADVVCDAYEEHANTDEDKITPEMKVSKRENLRKGDYITVELVAENEPLTYKSLTVFIDGEKTKIETNAQGKVGFRIDELGDHSFKVIFSGDKKYNPKRTSFKKTIVEDEDYDEFEGLEIDENKMAAWIHVDETEKVTMDDYIIIEIREESSQGAPIANENFDIFINGIPYTRKTNEYGKIGITPLEEGVNHFKVFYEGNDKLNPTVYEFTKTIVDEEEVFAYDESDMDEDKIMPRIRAPKEKTFNLGDRITIDFREETENGKPIIDAPVSIFINDVKFNRKTNKYGKIGLIATEPGTNNFKVNFHGTDEINPKTIIFSRKVVELDEKDAYDESDIDKDKIMPLIQTPKEKTFYLGDRITIDFREETEDGKPIIDAPASIFINDVKFNRKTNKYGKIGLIATEPGTNNFKVNFHGTDEINPKTITFSKVVEEGEKDAYDESDIDKDKIMPWIKASEEETVSIGDKIVIRFKEESENGKSIKDAPVSIFINGVKFNRRTNKYGNIGFRTTELGTNNFKVNFHGTDEINPKTITFTKEVVE